MCFNKILKQEFGHLVLSPSPVRPSGEGRVGWIRRNKVCLTAKHCLAGWIEGYSDGAMKTDGIMGKCVLPI